MEQVPPSEVFYLSRDSNYYIYKYNFIREEDKEFIYVCNEIDFPIYINKTFDFKNSKHTFCSLMEAEKYRDFEINNKKL